MQHQKLKPPRGYKWLPKWKTCTANKKEWPPQLDRGWKHTIETLTTSIVIFPTK